MLYFFAIFISLLQSSTSTNQRYQFIPNKRSLFDHYQLSCSNSPVVCNTLIDQPTCDSSSEIDTFSGSCFVCLWNVITLSCSIDTTSCTCLTSAPTDTNSPTELITNSPTELITNS